MKTVARYAALYLHLASFSARRSLEFRIEFLFRILMDLLYAVAMFGVFAVVFTQTPILAGWTYEECLIFMAGWLVVDGLQMMLFNANLAAFPLLVNRGDLDYYLVRPVSTLFMVSLNTFTLNSTVNFLMWCGFLWWSIAHYSGEIAPMNLVVYLLLLLNGAAVYYLIRMSFVLPVFWLGSATGFEAVFYSSYRLGERPDDIFGVWLRRFLTSLLPFALMSSVPTKILLGKLSPWHFFSVLGITIGLFGVIVIIWRIGLRHYGSASS